MPTTSDITARHLPPDDEPCLPNAVGSVEPMHRPDYRAKKHGRPMPVRYKRKRTEDAAEQQAGAA